MFVMIVNGLITLSTIIINLALSLLPNTPFDFNDVDWGPFGSLVGYVLPVQKMYQHMIAILIAITIYYGVRNILRIARSVK